MEELTGAYVSKVKGGSKNDKQVDLLYKTPKGDTTIWESNFKVLQDEPLNSYETTYIGNHEWNYDKDLKLFYSNINGLQIQVTGEIPKEQLINIIKSLNTNHLSNESTDSN
ncbi:hypothetical protein HPT25_03620 [Bacillus sp. BRMEA1]|uniref:hypothetical protein n=1 Tax=Neobacillus endophyticus TaxID=2738405 RepID=UPI001566398A|nr:hypothetical protein [Neobacillus endophyticus]NRD76579.1 hypothetical protein [Neobacillus endophyticus]